MEIIEWLNIFLSQKNVLQRKYYLVHEDHGLCINVERPKLFDTEFPVIDFIPQQWKKLEKEDLTMYLPNGKLLYIDIQDPMLLVEMEGKRCSFCSATSIVFYKCNQCTKYMCAKCFNICNQVYWWDTSVINPLLDIRTKEILKNKNGEMICFNTHKAFENVIDIEAVNYNVINTFDTQRIGSFLDWIPILYRHDEEFEESEFVLYNINQKSCKYHHVAKLRYNDRGCGFIKVLKKSLNQHLQKLSLPKSGSYQKHKGKK